MPEIKPCYIGSSGIQVEAGTGDTLPVNNIPVMGAASDSVDGIGGAVPAPLAGDENKFLRGDKTWGVASSFMSAESRFFTQF